MVHHDLKPDNIVYNEKHNSLKIIDFGLLKKKKDIIKDSEQNKYGFSKFHFNIPPELFFYNKHGFDNIEPIKNDKTYLMSVNILMAFVNSSLVMSRKSAK